MKRFLFLFFSFIILLSFSACSTPLPGVEELKAEGDIKLLGNTVGLYGYNFPSVLPLTDLVINKSEKVDKNNYYIYYSVTFEDEYYKKDIDARVLCRLNDNNKWIIILDGSLSQKLTPLQGPPEELISDELNDYFSTYELNSPSFSETEQACTISGFGINEQKLCIQKENFILECDFIEEHQGQKWIINVKSQSISNEWKYDIMNGFSFTTKGGGASVSEYADITLHKFNTQNQTVDMSFKPRGWSETARVTVPYEIHNSETRHPYIEMAPRGSAWSSLRIYPDKADFGFYGNCSW